MSKMNSMKEDGKTILMLSLISSSSKKGWLGITKLQKLSFLTEYFLMEKSQRAFGYEFFMYDHGPISKGVYQDYESLLDKELIDEDEDGIKVSEFGDGINEQFKVLIPEEVKTTMCYVVKHYAHLETHELVKAVHGMNIKLADGSIVRIDDIDRSCVLLPETSDTAFKIEKSYMETFAVLSNKSSTNAIRAARKNKSRSKPYESLVSS